MDTGHKTFSYVLFDDEYLTTRYLERTVSRLRPGYSLIGATDSVRNIERIINTTHPDFIITGIRLSDGVSLHEYRRLNCTVPKVVFTAHSDYLSQLDGLNVVHCALKPVSEQEVERAVCNVEASLSA